MQQLRNFIILVFLLTASKSLFSQNRLSGKVKGATVRSTKKIYKNAADSMSICGDLIPITDTSEMALYIVDNILIPPDSRETLIFLNVDSLSEALVYQKNDPRSKTYGELGKNGVIILNYKPKVKLVPLNDILLKMLGDSLDKTLNIFVNKIPIKHPDKLFIDHASVIDVQITTDQSKSDNFESKTSRKYINVITQ